VAPSPSRISEAEGSEQRRDVVAILLGAFPLGIAGAISLLHVRADQLVLAGMHYRNGLANYAVSYRALEAIVGGITTVSVVAFSTMSRSPAEERAERARTATTLLVGREPSVRWHSLSPLPSSCQSSVEQAIQERFEAAVYSLRS